MVYGNVHSFETFGTVDGPGVRFVVFMQGCNLQCKYCHNRDTWECVQNITITSEELIGKIMKNAPYYGKTPKVTFSGGEPLLQQDFLLDFIPKAKQKNIEIAIDTNGCFELTEKLKKIIDEVDIFLVDIKHIDDEKCKELTGHSNKQELEFIQYLISQNKRIYIRQVFVPSVHDNPLDVLKLRKFFDENKKYFEQIDILPYHDLGAYKWGESKPNFEIPTQLQVEDFKRNLGLDEKGEVEG